MRLSDEGETVVKAAETDEERQRLGREADFLRRVAHPGVVRLVGVEGDATPGTADRLILARVPGANLADHGALPPASVATWAAEVATTVADLHDVGWVHGNLRAEHVLLDGQGRPVLCGFSRVERVAWGHAGPSQLRTVDEDTLVKLILEHVSGSGTSIHRAVARWERRRRRGGLRALAEALASETRTAPVESRSHLRRSRGRHQAGQGRRYLLISAGGALLVALLTVLVVSGSSGRTNGHRVGPVAAPSEVAVPAYLLEWGRGVAAITAIGTWGCGPARPAVLDPATGRVWIFGVIPGPGGRTSGLLVGRVGGATGLAAEMGTGGCDRLTVLRGQAPSVAMSLPSDG